MHALDKGTVRLREILPALIEGLTLQPTIGLVKNDDPRPEAPGSGD